ncbi:MAG TPA: hypothetical protein PLM53_02035 [Spirochaetota bacterium]|nr:hypothetical protein [Spirochaetota bacterium]HPC41193.1 hypothetical protein [Spirochaetota bacterium]HPL17134.1 hypothetical protein [Spirochaetota bacterium]HQF07113.1 hypothetical protein [Spirochaetota bacterium]HQH95850.1 hypothetical protein [Spirochaetota bacterium]
MKLHSAVGGRLGITGDEIEKLIALDPKDFEYREWLALKYAQDWTALGGDEPAGSHMDDFRKMYSPRERAYILKLMRMMRFANYFNNTFRGRAWRRDLGQPGACSLDDGGQPRTPAGNG